MTIIWLLVKDHVRRSWKQLALGSFMLCCLSSLFMDKDVGIRSPWPIFFGFAMLSYSIADSFKADALRIWRTLPFRKSSLAKMVWALALLTPPLLSFLVVLLTAFWEGYRSKADAQWIPWSFLFLLLVTFCSGLIVLASALHRFSCAFPREVPRARRTLSSSTSHPVLLHALIVCAGALLLYPNPARWSDLGLSHLAGMCMAAGLTWKSYQMRFWLLEPAFGQGGRTFPAPTQEGPALHADSAWNALARDLRNTAQQTIVSLLVIVGFCYAVVFCVSFSGLIPNAGDIKNVSMLGAGICILVGIKLIFDELDRASMLGVVHSLPLTANQSVLLLLSYPYAAALAALPCMALSLWLAGATHILLFLLAGALHVVALCPLGMFIIACFGPQGLRPIVMVAAFLIIPGGVIMSTAIYLPTHGSPQILLAAISALATLCGTGYFGLRHLVQNSSHVYKRKLSPQQFGQQVQR